MAQIDAGQKVRWQGEIWRVAVCANGVLKLRPELGGGRLATGVSVSEVELPDAQGAFAPVKESKAPAKAAERTIAEAQVSAGYSDSMLRAVKEAKAVVPPAQAAVQAEAVSGKVFDYNALKQDDAIAVRMAVKEIKDVMRRTAEGILQIGESLVDVQSRLANYQTGTFTRWLALEFEWSQSTAYRYMDVYKTFGRFPTVGNLKFAAQALYTLAASDSPAAVEDAVQRAEAGEAITGKAAVAIVAQHAPTPPTPAAAPEPPALGHTARPVDEYGEYLEAPVPTPTPAQAAPDVSDTGSADVTPDVVVGTAKRQPKPSQPNRDELQAELVALRAQVAWLESERDAMMTYNQVIYDSTVAFFEQHLNPLPDEDKADLMAVVAALRGTLLRQLKAEETP